MSSIIIIPTYNERDNIEELVNQILKLNLDVLILTQIMREQLKTQKAHHRQTKEV